VADRAYDAVTFDFWQTLCLPDEDRGRGRRLVLTRSVLDSEGIAVTDEEIDGAMLTVLERFDEAWAANRQFVARDAVDVLAELIAPTLSDDGRARLAARYEAPGEALAPLAPNITETLRALKDAGLRLGIICDVGMIPSPLLRSTLERHGILDLFDHWSFSDEVGIYKPSPEIFQHALTGLGGVEPARAAHVGDLRRTDIAGARASGMTSVRYRGWYDDTKSGMESDELPDADHVIDDHAELPPLLGVV
jgi:putative hydrolase of the HAD superfamily